MEEWSCMTSNLKDLDKEFTALCRIRAVSYEEIAARQRVLYSTCASQSDSETIECALLSEDPRCTAEMCN
jgi:hypothetical protein